MFADKLQTNEDGLRTMVMQTKDRLENYTHAKKEKGIKKWQLTRPEPATFRFIADPLAAEPWSPSASILKY